MSVIYEWKKGWTWNRDNVAVVIVRKTLVKKTEKTVTFMDTGYETPKPQRNNINTSYSQFFDTFDEAKTAAIEHWQLKVNSLEGQLERAREILAVTRDMTIANVKDKTVEPEDQSGV